MDPFVFHEVEGETVRARASLRSWFRITQACSVGVGGREQPPKKRGRVEEVRRSCREFCLRWARQAMEKRKCGGVCRYIAVRKRKGAATPP